MSSVITACLLSGQRPTPLAKTDAIRMKSETNRAIAVPPARKSERLVEVQMRAGSWHESYPRNQYEQCNQNARVRRSFDPNCRRTAWFKPVIWYYSDRSDASGYAEQAVPRRLIENE